MNFGTKGSCGKFTLVRGLFNRHNDIAFNLLNTTSGFIRNLVAPLLLMSEIPAVTDNRRGVFSQLQRNTWRRTMANDKANATIGQTAFHIR